MASDTGPTICPELEDEGDFESTASDARDPYDVLHASQEAHDAVGRLVEADELEAAFWRSLNTNHAHTEEGAVQMDRPFFGDNLVGFRPAPPFGDQGSY